jgi:hypothetical protein
MNSFMLVAPIAAAIALIASSVGAENNNKVKWTLYVGNPGVSVPLPVTLFKDRPVPIKSERWRCFVDNALRQDAEANTFSALTIHCSDGETTVITSASCLIGSNANDRVSVELVEKATTLSNSLRAQCSGW